MKRREFFNSTARGNTVQTLGHVICVQVLLILEILRKMMIFRTRAFLGDPSLVTFREGKTIDQLDTTKPQPYIPSTPTAATTMIQLIPTNIHPWYMVPIRQCLICRVYHQNLVLVSDNFDLCEACVRNWNNYCKDSTKTNWSYSREHLFVQL